MRWALRWLTTLLVLASAMVYSGAAPVAAAPGPTDAPEWWFDQWHIQDLWNAGARGQNIKIAEIDTGVNAALPELAANVIPGKDFGSAGGDGRVDRSVDAFGHGTAMASIMVAHPGLYGITGIAPNAVVLPIAVPISGTEDAAASDSVPAAIRYAADSGANVISMSLGGVRQPGVDSLPCPALEQAAIDYAIGKGAIVVAASGNAGQSGSPVEDPGVCLGVVSVGAVDRDGVVAPFSSRHSYLTVTAPGVNIASLGRSPGTAYSGNGTSQATAITSAVLALTWSMHRDLSGRQVVARLLWTLDRRQPVRDPAYGFGRVDAQTAVMATVPATAPNPVYAALDPFLARDSAASAAQTNAPPAAMPVRVTPPGSFEIGSLPGPVTSRVIAGAAAAGCGLLALIALGLGHRRNRRRRHAQHRLAGHRSPYPSDEWTWYDVSASPHWATPPDGPF